MMSAPRRQQRPPGSDPTLDLSLSCLAAAALGLLLLTSVPVGCALSGVAAGHGWAWLPAARWGQLARRLLDAPGRPATWYPPDWGGPRPAGSPWLVWAGVAAAALGAAACALLVRRVLRAGAAGSTFDAALAGRRDARRLTAGRLRRGGAVLRPDLPARRPWRRAPDSDSGLYVGLDKGTSQGAIRTSHEDTVAVIGPPRSYKSRMLMIRRIAESPGGLLATSLRKDLLLATIVYRRGLGRPVHVLDPTNVSGWPRRSRVDLIAGCLDTHVAERRANNLVLPAAGGGDPRDSDWQEAAAVVMRCYLHAAAVGGKTVLDLIAWSANSRDTSAAALLARSPVAPFWAYELAGKQAEADETRESVWMNVRRGLAALSQPDVVDFLTPGEGGEGFDFARAIEEAASVYVIGDPARPAVARITTMIVGELMAEAFSASQRRPGQRLAPPFHFHLDEADKVAAVPELPSYLSFFGGSGLPTTLVFQGLGGPRSVWGRDGAEQIWNNSLQKIILPGLANADDLEEISRLIGDVWVQTRGLSFGRGGGAGVSLGEQQLRAIPPDRIRTLQRGTGLMLPNALHPLHLQLTAWDEGPLAKRLKAGYDRARELTGAAEDPLSGGAGVGEPTGGGPP